MSTDLPPPLGAYFEASNAHDADLLASLFSPGASVRDEGEEMVGQAAIRAWAEETFRKYDVAATPEAVAQEGGAILVTAEVSGTFPGSPIRLGYRFEAVGATIAKLEIG
jgi:hypothetical protein